MPTNWLRASSCLKGIPIDLSCGSHKPFGQKITLALNTVPLPDEPTRIEARVSDADGVRQVKLYWTIDTPALPESGKANELVMEENPTQSGSYSLR